MYLCLCVHSWGSLLTGTEHLNKCWNRKLYAEGVQRGSRDTKSSRFHRCLCERASYFPRKLETSFCFMKEWAQPAKEFRNPLSFVCQTVHASFRGDRCQNQRQGSGYKMLTGGQWPWSNAELLPARRSDLQEAGGGQVAFSTYSTFKVGLHPTPWKQKPLPPYCGHELADRALPAVSRFMAIEQSFQFKSTNTCRALPLCPAFPRVNHRLLSE